MRFKQREVQSPARCAEDAAALTANRPHILHDAVHCKGCVAVLSCVECRLGVACAITALICSVVLGVRLNQLSAACPEPVLVKHASFFSMRTQVFENNAALLMITGSNRLWVPLVLAPQVVE